MNLVHYKDSEHEYFYYLDDRNNRILHREDDLPAFIVYRTNSKSYVKHGKMHREFGPAYIMGNYKSWWHEGKFISDDYGFNQQLFKLALLNVFL